VSVATAAKAQRPIIPASGRMAQAKGRRTAMRKRCRQALDRRQTRTHRTAAPPKKAEEGSAARYWTRSGCGG
jgi:hypothetical protein